MHIIIIGGDAVGYSLAKALATQHEVAVVDPNPQCVNRFSDLDVSVITGRGTNPDRLRQAGITSDSLLIAATSLDEVNIVACSLGSQLGASQTICFVSKEDFLHAPGGTQHLKEHFGIDHIVWPDAQLASAMERVINVYGAINADTFAGGRVQLVEFLLNDVSPLINRSLAQVSSLGGVVLVALKRDNKTTVPHGETVLLSGDKIVLMGTQEGMQRVRDDLLPAHRDDAIQLVTIIGGGDVGFRLAQQLDKSDGIRLQVIEENQRRAELLAQSLKNGLVLRGDGTDLELLESEDIGRSDVLVSVIGNDERNLLASLLGRQLGVDRVVTRVSHPSNLRLFERVGIDVVLSAHGAAVASILHQIDGGRASLLTVLEEGEARVLDIPVPGNFSTSLVSDLGLPNESVIGTVLRDGKVIVPRGEDDVRAGDHLLVCCTASAVTDVRDLFS
tara:strand:- start:9489 stop:10826 length:1338 start_codon:yes stop_codon:yes gene_type:complete